MSGAINGPVEALGIWAMHHPLVSVPVVVGMAGVCLWILKPERKEENYCEFCDSDFPTIGRLNGRAICNRCLASKKEHP